ncbi:DUF935 domain-containing protein [Termitidicoccus mucosus]|uniref:Portal protein n=1 Tax=Termitidicoccus mucosus TaxID=1184151 RepID=A0A178IJC3_9BACT|nr:hypothetical protein AW736_13875 [Opitutaceae bacterium TSB47]
MSTATPGFNLDIVSAQRRSRFNPLANFDPAVLTRQLQEFRAGRLRDLAMSMDAIEETDDTLMCVVPKAKAAVARHGYEILTIDTEDAAQAEQAEKQKETLEHFYNHLSVTNALDLDEEGGVSLLLRQMMDAKGKRYAVHHIVWQPAAKGRYTATLWQVPLWFFENTTGRMRFIEEPYGYDGVAMERGAWMVTKGLGVSIACAVAWTFKHLPLRDWLIYSERAGMPGIEGVTDAQPGSEEWKQLVQAVTEAAKEFKWVRNRSSEIKTIEFSTTGELPYPKLVERMDRALAALWRGADLSTISAGQGQGQGASLQGEESAALEADDAQWLSESLQTKLDRLVIEYVYGPDTPVLAYFQVRGADKKNIDTDLKVDAFALQNGHPISKKQFAERYQRPLPDEEDELLAPPAAPAPSFPPGADEAARREAINESATDALYNARALALLTGAERAALAPLLDALAVVERAGDADTPAALKAFEAAIAAHAPRLLADPALAAAWEKVLAPAAVEGVANALKP